MHDEGGLLDILANTEEGEEPHAALYRLQPVHKGDLQKGKNILVYGYLLHYGGGGGVWEKRGLRLEKEVERELKNDYMANYLISVHNMYSIYRYIHI